jgi:hypothetical protein
VGHGLDAANGGGVGSLELRGEQDMEPFELVAAQLLEQVRRLRA